MNTLMLIQNIIKKKETKKNDYYNEINIKKKIKIINNIINRKTK